MRIKIIFQAVVYLAFCFSLSAAMTFWSLGDTWTESFLASLATMGVCVMLMPLRHLHAARLVSTVEGYQGPCVPSWLNKNQMDYMLTGAVTGFFRKAVKVPFLPLCFPVGPEFHGYIKNDLTVASTKGHFTGHLAV